MVKQILTEQGVFNYQVNGNGPTLIFIHGFLESSAIWDSTVSKFSNGYKIINIDLPGHGLNHHLHSFYSLKHMAALVVTVLQQEKSLKPIVFGHSMGGYVGLEIEQIFSIHLVLIHSNFWIDSPQKKIDRHRLIQVVEENKKSFINLAIPNLFAKRNVKNHWVAIENLKGIANEIDKRVIQNCTRAMVARNNFSTFAQKADWQLIQGDFDPIISLEQMQLKLENTSLQLHILNNCGHMGFIEQPKQFEQILEQIISGLS